MEQDQEHLRLLSIFHYIVAGIAGLVACLPIMPVVAGITMLTGVFSTPPDAWQPPAAVGWVFIGLGAFASLALWTLAGVILFVARSLARSKHYTFCLVVAAIECLFPPFGTVLGIFSLIVLTRPSVRALFEQGSG